MTSATYIDGASGMQKGVDNAETGIKIDSLEHSMADPKTYSFNEDGSADGFCHNYNPSITITISGEVSDENAGLCLSQYGTAITFANRNNAKLTDLIGGDTTSDNAFAGISDAGGFYADSISFSESRDGFRTLSITAIRHPEIT